MKVQDLTGAMLDYWVAKAEGLDVRFASDKSYVIVNTYPWSPSTNWCIAGQIIEREGISTMTRPAGIPKDGEPSRQERQSSLAPLP